MTDHTPSPATDGLREAIEALRVIFRERFTGDFGGWDWASDNDVQALAVAVSRVIHPALLADPAPEAAREGKPFNPPPCPSCGRYNGWHVHNCPADLPVATGVTTEDEGCAAGHLEHGECACPAPAPVVSAGDEGVGLREVIASSLNIVGPLRHIFGAHSTSKELLDALEVLLDQEIDVLAELLAARVAEAGARAHDELAAMIIRLAQSNAILARANGRGDDERRWLDLIHVMEADKALGVDQ